MYFILSISLITLFSNLLDLLTLLQIIIIFLNNLIMLQHEKLLKIYYPLIHSYDSIIIILNHLSLFDVVILLYLNILYSTLFIMIQSIIFYSTQLNYVFVNLYLLLCHQNLISFSNTLLNIKLLSNLINSSKNKLFIFY